VDLPRGSTRINPNGLLLKAQGIKGVQYFLILQK
jgi:hypothetical protein